VCLLRRDPLISGLEIKLEVTDQRTARPDPRDPPSTSWTTGRRLRSASSPEGEAAT
jgi:hypothetical protein